jgi:light-regulated signal transduction histidine kinase (bacteriophytochrome)
MYGFTREEALGKVSHVLLCTDFPEPLSGILEILFRDGRWSGELSHACSSGRRIVTLSRWVAERDENGDVIRILESNNDITERVRAQAQLRRANQDLEHFAYSASHDLKEPLRTINIYSELLATSYAPRLDQRGLAFLQKVQDGATRMEVLINDILAYAQAAAVDSTETCASANTALQVALANLAGLIAETEAEVDYGTLPEVRVQATALRQLFQNLIGNAIKYRRPGIKPIVRVEAKNQIDHWLFSVKDNGIGIDIKYREQIFGLFKRLHSGDEYSGSGIGLSLCERIVERHHGRIWVESDLEHGSTFYFTLPL